MGLLAMGFWVCGGCRLCGLVCCVCTGWCARRLGGLLGLVGLSLVSLGAKKGASQSSHLGGDQSPRKPPLSWVSAMPPFLPHRKEGAFGGARFSSRRRHALVPPLSAKKGVIPFRSGSGRGLKSCRSSVLPVRHVKRRALLGVEHGRP